MGPLALIIVFELVFSGSILGLSTHPQVLNNTKHKISSVLGIQKIAEAPDDSTPPSDTSNTPSAPTDNSSTTTPAETSAPSPSQQPDSTSATPTPAPTVNPEPATELIPVTSSDQSSNSTTSAESPVPDQNPTGSPSPTNNPNLFEENSSPTPAPPGQENTSPSPQPSEQPTPTPSTTEASTVQTSAVLNPDDLINSPENISNQSVEEAKKEDSQITQTTDPAEQTKLLVNFATDKVKDMSNFTKSDDFSSTNFAASRFNDQIDQAINNLEKLPPKQQAQLKSKLTNLCTQADQVLRTVELSVPEESEQDIQIARGQCQELEL